MEKKNLIISEKTDEKQLPKIANENLNTEFIKEDLCNIKYDTCNLKIYTIDGAFIRIDKEEGRLLCFVHYPNINCTNSDKVKPKIQNRCVCELRMPASILRYITCCLIDEIKELETLEKKKQPISELLKKEDTTQEVMFA